MTSGGTSPLFGSVGLPTGDDGSGSPADEVLARFPDTVSQVQEDAIRAFIDAEVAAGNWECYDEIFLLPLGPVNGITGWFSKTAINNGATIDGSGAALDGRGSSYIDTTFVANTDAVAFALTDANISVDVTVGTPTVFQTVTGVRENTPDTSPTIQITSNNGGVGYQLFSTLFGPIGTFPAGARAHLQVDNVAGTGFMYLNGAELGPCNGSALGLPTRPFFAGAYNDFGTPKNFVTGTLRFWAIGKSFTDRVAHNTNLTTLLTAIGAI